MCVCACGREVRLGFASVLRVVVCLSALFVGPNRPGHTGQTDKPHKHPSQPTRPTNAHSRTRTSARRARTEPEPTPRSAPAELLFCVWLCA